MGLLLAAIMHLCIIDAYGGTPMNNLFFIDVDTQRDFMLPSGALSVPGAERMIPKLRRLFDFARKNDIVVISTADAHREDDVEFQQFPPHCVKGSEGQKKLDDTLLPHPFVIPDHAIDRNLMELVRRNRQIIVEKAALDPFSSPMLERVLRVLPPRAIVFGVTTEYCVKLVCLGARERGIRVVVVEDAIRPLAPDTERVALSEMRKAGVEFITVDTLVGAGA